MTQGEASEDVFRRRCYFPVRFSVVVGVLLLCFVCLCLLVCFVFFGLKKQAKGSFSDGSNNLLILCSSTLQRSSAIGPQKKEAIVLLGGLSHFEVLRFFSSALGFFYVFLGFG